MDLNLAERSFRAGPVEIAYLDEGDGDPIVLVHGFASNKEVNWVYPGWVATLTRAGRRVIALDNRGHGASTKLYDPALYGSALMAEDVRALIDHLGFVAIVKIAACNVFKLRRRGQQNRRCGPLLRCLPVGHGRLETSRVALKIGGNGARVE